jgi:hypothetical protein
VTPEKEQTLRELVKAFESDIDEAIRRAHAPKGGQHVPNFSDFANIPLSRLLRLQWWAKTFRAQLE